MTTICTLTHRVLKMKSLTASGETVDGLYYFSTSELV
eukprot:COSAG02_NODE_3401_length_6805_cov_70.980763_4_plen_37_part_00